MSSGSCSRGPGRALRAIVRGFGPRGPGGTCCEELGMPEFLALERAGAVESCPVQEIGRALGFTKSGATRVVHRLHEKGLVEKLRSAEDARICCVVPTELGRSLLAEAFDQFDEELRRKLSRLEPARARLLEELLEELASTLPD